MLKIGITGSFASGKSSVLHYLESKGYNSFSCDECVRELYNDQIVVSTIIEAFPELESFNKQKLSKIIYADKKKRQKLELIIHPLVATKLESFLSVNNTEKKVFIEIPLLFEAGWEKYCDIIVNLYCDKNIREKRAAERGIKTELFTEIDKAQLPESIKIQSADINIDTSQAWNKVTDQLEELLDL